MSTLFPYTTLFRSVIVGIVIVGGVVDLIKVALVIPIMVAQLDHRYPQAQPIIWASVKQPTVTDAG